MRDLHQIMKDMGEYFKFIEKHYKAFLKEFCKSEDATDIVSLSFGPGELIFRYTLKSGSNTLIDIIFIEQLIDWMRKTRGEYP